MREIKEIWRGWQGHFCCQCRFHLNTLITNGNYKVVVSTVGEYYPLHEPNKMDTIDHKERERQIINQRRRQ